MDKLASDLLTIKEAFRELQGKVSINTIYQAVESTRLLHYRVSGCGRRGKILIRREDLLSWLEAQKVTPSFEEDEWL